MEICKLKQAKEVIENIQDAGNDLNFNSFQFEGLKTALFCIDTLLALKKIVLGQSKLFNSVNDYDMGYAEGWNQAIDSVAGLFEEEKNA